MDQHRLNYDTIEAYAERQNWSLVFKSDGYWIDSMASLQPASEPGVWYLSEIGRHGALEVSTLDEMEEGLEAIRGARRARTNIFPITGHILLGVGGAVA